MKPYGSKRLPVCPEHGVSHDGPSRSREKRKAAEEICDAETVPAGGNTEDTPWDDLDLSETAE